LKLPLRRNDIEDIKTTVKDFQNSATNAVKVVLMERNTFLMGICFSSSLTERLIRTDEYGGSGLKARIFEVLDAIKKYPLEEKIEPFNPSLNGPFERLWMQETTQRLEYIE
jgi:N-ethylmaleimide reductase